MERLPQMYTILGSFLGSFVGKLFLFHFQDFLFSEEVLGKPNLKGPSFSKSISSRKYKWPSISYLIFDWCELVTLAFVSSNSVIGLLIGFS